MKQIILPIIATIVFICLVGLFVQGKIFPQKGGILVQKHIVKIGTSEINVELADTADKRQMGLSGRTSLKEGTGMLFVFDQKETKASFWMKDMVIPIDIIWIHNNKIVQIDKNIQAPKANTLDIELKRYSPIEVINYVLEVPAGYSDKSGFAVGDSVDLSSI